MEQDPQQWFQMAKTISDIGGRLGPVVRMASRLVRRKYSEPAEVTLDYRDEAVTAALENALEKITGQELTIEQAFQMIDRVVTFDDLNKLNSTWQRHWSEGAAGVGIDDQERRTWWARLLAGEIQKPGTFSLRAMAVMNTLSTEEARLFTRLCDYVWVTDHPVLIPPEDKSALWQPNFSDVTRLENCGLLMSTAGNYSLTSSEIRQGTSYLQLSLRHDTYRIEIPAGQTVKLRRGKLQLTDVGQEMHRLATPDCSLSYRDEIVAEWRRSYTVHELPVVAA